jgi:uncharacterized protein (TIGR03435 family)
MAMLMLLAAAAPGQVFEAASIKPAGAVEDNSGWNETPGRVKMDNVTLRQLVEYAWRVKDYQISGGPKWMETDRFQIVAKLEDTGTPPSRDKNGDPRLRAAMRALLADRFHMVSHTETRDLSGYALVRAKGGFKPKAVEEAESTSNNWGNGKATLSHASIASLADVLTAIVGRPVLDRTEIAGVYDMKLEYADENRPDAKGPSLFTALEEQLGLRLEARKVPVEIVVVDKAEKPGEN